MEMGDEIFEYLQTGFPVISFQWVDTLSDKAMSDIIFVPFVQ